jgi:hypothetical protein
MRPKAKWPIRLFFGLAFVVFTCVYPYKLLLNNPNENVRVYTVLALVEHHSFRLDEVIERQGWVNDMARVPDAAGQQHFFSVKGPAIAYAGAPIYWVFTKIAPLLGHPIPTPTSTPEEKAWWIRTATITLRIFVVQIPCFAFLVWFERWLRPTTKDPILRLAGVAAAGLGTNYLAYSLMLVSHALDAVTAFLAFGILTNERRRPPWSRRFWTAAIAGFLAGVCSLLEYQAFLLSVFLAGYAVFAYRRLRPLLGFGLGATITALALMLFQWRAFNNPLTPGYKLAENPMFADMHQQGFYGLVSPKWEVFRDLSTNPAFGFFGTSPFMWIGLFGGVFVILFESRRGERGRRRVGTLIWALMMLALWVAMSAAVNWRGGWTVGPRFLGPAPPFFAFGAVCALELLSRQRRFWRVLARGLACGLCLASVCTLGFVSLVVTSIPEDVTLPLAGMALPLARAGFVPHHAAELFGWTTPTFWYFTVACAIGAPLVALLWPAGDRGWQLLFRSSISIIAFVLAMGPELSGFDPSQPDANSLNVAEFARGWEPANRDFVSVLRERAELEGANQPCLWHQLAQLERTVALNPEAARDDARSRTSKTECR